MGDGRAVPLVLAQVYIFRRRFIFFGTVLFFAIPPFLPAEGLGSAQPRGELQQEVQLPPCCGFSQVYYAYIFIIRVVPIIRMVTTESLGWLPSGGTELGGGDRGERCGFGAGRETSGTRSRCRHPLSVQEAKKQRPET